MLVDRDIAPQRSVYFIGARLIQILGESRFEKMDLGLAFTKLNKGVDGKLKVSFDYFILALDWLFLIDAIKTDEKGDILRCF